MKIYGYVRISTMYQNEKRQIENIRAVYPDAIILTEEYTGLTMDRPVWSKLYPKLKSGDVIVFDEVSRMSRNAEEGFRAYEDLFNRGVSLIFLKEPHINTEVYKDVAQIKETGDKDFDETVARGINEYLMRLAKKQIQIAFEQSEAESDFRKQRQKEGYRDQKDRNEAIKLRDPENYKSNPEYHQLGRETGDKLNIKKAKPIMELIRKYSKDFDGTLNDKELLGVLSTKTVKIPTKKRSGEIEEKEISAKLARNTLYKYKRMMKSN